MAMQIYRPAKKYRKKFGSPTTSAPYFSLLKKKRRIKTNPPRTPKAIPRKNMDQTLSLNGNNIPTPFRRSGDRYDQPEFVGFNQQEQEYSRIAAQLLISRVTRHLVPSTGSAAAGL